MTSKETEPRPTSAMLEAYLLGDLDPVQTEALEAVIESDPALATWTRARKAEMAAFALEPRRRSFAELVAQAERTERRSWGALLDWRGWTFALAAAACLTLVAVVPRDAIGPNPSGARLMRPKGDLPVQVAVQRDGAKAYKLPADKRVHPGDRLRLMTESHEGGYSAVLMEDARGEVSVLYQPDELGRLDGGRFYFPGSLRLDDSLGRERIYVVLSPARVDVERLRAEIETYHRRGGFDHGWLPPAPMRFALVEYTKVP